MQVSKSDRKLTSTILVELVHMVAKLGNKRSDIVRPRRELRDVGYRSKSNITRKLNNFKESKKRR